MSKYYKDHYDVIVIGASLAGLACAITLRKKGFDVLVLEQHNLPGGVATSFVRGGVEIEASLHEMMSISSKECPLKIRRFLEENDINVDWVKVPIAYRYIDQDTDVVVRAGTNGDFSIPAHDIASACDDKDGTIEKKLVEFFELCFKVYNSLNIISEKSLSKFKMVKEHPEFVKTIGYSFDEVIEKYHLPKKIKDIVAGYWHYLGTPTDDMPFTVYAFLLADYFGYGSYIPRHTSYELALKMLESAIDKGIQVEFNQKVAKILVESHKTKGIRTEDGEIITSDYVVSGAYPNTVYSRMIEPLEEVPTEAIKWTNGMELGVSCFSIVMLLDKDYREFGFKDYSTFYAPEGNDTRAIFDSGKKLLEWRYITTTCNNIAHEDASPKGTCLYSITFLPMGDCFRGVSPENYNEYKDKIVSYFLDVESKRTGVNLKDHIIEIVVETPVTISHYTGAYKGTIYGYRHSLKNHSVARNQMEKKERFISGLAFAGAHQETGDGMSAAILNGNKAAQYVFEEAERRKGGK